MSQKIKRGIIEQLSVSNKIVLKLMMTAVVLSHTFYSSTIILIKDVCWYTFCTLSVCYICLLMNREGTLIIGCPGVEVVS